MHTTQRVIKGVNISDAKTNSFRLRLLRAKSLCHSASKNSLFWAALGLGKTFAAASLALVSASACTELSGCCEFTLHHKPKELWSWAVFQARIRQKKHTIILITQLSRVPSARPHIPTPSGGANVSSCTAVGKTILNILNDLLDHKNNKTVSGSRGLG